MQIQWTDGAINNLEAIERYIAIDNPTATSKTIAKILRFVEHLMEQPALGRPGRIPGTRELVIPNTPFIVPYRKNLGIIEILRVQHGAMSWPTEF